MCCRIKLGVHLISLTSSLTPLSLSWGRSRTYLLGDETVEQGWIIPVVLVGIGLSQPTWTSLKAEPHSQPSSESGNLCGCLVFSTTEIRGLMRSSVSCHWNKNARAKQCQKSKVTFLARRFRGFSPWLADLIPFVPRWDGPSSGRVWERNSANIMVARKQKREGTWDPISPIHNRPTMTTDFY